MILEGTIEEVVYRNEDNGYTVAVISHGEEYTTIVGKMLTISVGQNVRLYGKYVTNSKYGQQFSFESAETIMPSSIEGIEKYLASGLIKGVGPVTAKAIVEKFKEDTLEIIEFNPERLASVRGISKNKAQEIGQVLADLKKLQNTMLFLQQYNITTNMALRIFNIYAENTIEIVKQNPYKLVEDIDGIGFLTADKIAMSMGIEKNSPFRIRASFLHLLNESSEKGGNTYLPVHILIRDAVKLLEQDKEFIENIADDIIKNLCLENYTVRFWKEKTDAIMLQKFYFAENSVAQKLAMLNVSAKVDNIEITNEIEMFENLNKIKLHIEQVNAIKTAVNSGVSVITGGPGTGKTTIIKCVINLLEQEKRKVILLAPTGRAAKRLNETTDHEAMTIHRCLELDFENDRRYFKYNENNPLKADCVIVDEVSMVDIMLMNSLLKALPRDCKLILVGDKDQLASVGAGNVLDDILKSGAIKVSYLTQIFRQEENSLIVVNAHAINNGEMPQIDNTSKDFFFDKKEDSADIKNTIIDMATKRIPNYLKIDATKIQILAPLKAGICGIDNLNVCLQEKFNPQSVLKKEIYVGKNIFRIGDRVMQISNNYDLIWRKQNGLRVEEGAGVFNGDIGYIHSINAQVGEIEVWFEDGRECTYDRTQIIDLVLAYAITIHKSQGSEFDVVIIPIISGPSIILTRNLIYTAVTRAKKMVVLIGDPTALKRMINNKQSVERYTMLKTFLETANKKLVELYG